MNDDVRSPGSGSTPGPLTAQPPPGLGDSEGKDRQLNEIWYFFIVWWAICDTPRNWEMLSKVQVNKILEH